MLVCQFLAVPVETKVHLYERGSWDHVSTLSDDLLTQVRASLTHTCVHEEDSMFLYERDFASYCITSCLKCANKVLPLP